MSVTEVPDKDECRMSQWRAGHKQTPPRGLLPLARASQHRGEMSGSQVGSWVWSADQVSRPRGDLENRSFPISEMHEMRGTGNFRVVREGSPGPSPRDLCL